MPELLCGCCKGKGWYEEKTSTFVAGGPPRDLLIKRLCMGCLGTGYLDGMATILRRVNPSPKED